jgi:antitoxin (DNA-binding transcriptional repressor) of toxin-antitoxin stability system
MKVVSMHQAKSSLSQLVHRAEQGEDIYIGAYGKAQAKIIAANKEDKPHKKIGVLAGKLHVPEDFDKPLPNSVLSSFENS